MGEFNIKPTTCKILGPLEMWSVLIQILQNCKQCVKLKIHVVFQSIKTMDELDSSRETYDQKFERSILRMHNPFQLRPTRLTLIEISRSSIRVRSLDSAIIVCIEGKPSEEVAYFRRQWDSDSEVSSILETHSSSCCSRNL